jgi:uncharacterized membrane protein
MRFTISVSVSFILVISLATMILSCKHDLLTPSDGVTPTDTTTNNPDTFSMVGWKCSPDTVYFQFDVLPIMISSCAPSGCHNAATKADGYQLTDYATVIKKGISAGRVTNSKLYTEIVKGTMPPKNSGITMTQAQKDMIAKWINQGAKNLTCNQSFGKCDTANVKFSSFVAPIVQNKCQGCHNSTPPLLSNYTQIKASVQSGKFAGSINHAAGFSAMPQGSAKLPTCELNKINAWIKAGARNN